MGILPSPPARRGEYADYSFSLVLKDAGVAVGDEPMVRAAIAALASEQLHGTRLTRRGIERKVVKSCTVKNPATGFRSYPIWNTVESNTDHNVSAGLTLVKLKAFRAEETNSIGFLKGIDILPTPSLLVSPMLQKFSI
jgi:hypothetical protein